MPKKLSCGWEYGDVEDVLETFELNHEAGLTFAAVNVCKSTRQRKIMECVARNEAVPSLGRADVQLRASEWDSVTVGRISTWLNLDSANAAVRKACETVMRQELDYAEHLSLPAIVLPSPRERATNYACFMNAHFLNYTTAQYWLRIPLTATEAAANEDAENAVRTNGDSEPREVDTWARWNEFRTLCDHTIKMYVALELTADLPDAGVLQRWLGEPVKAVIIPTDIFLTNAKGFPVLSKAHQQFVRNLMKYNVQVLLTGTPGHEQGQTAYYGYISHLHKKLAGDGDPLAEFAEGYEDYLQSPLQPLADNLESQTYEVFEKDPVKYREYQRAIYHALLDRVPDDVKDEVVTNIMVVGAGRGPLVRQALLAAEKARRKVNVWAVEKNPNAIIILQDRVANEWGDAVTLVATDMRDFHPKEKADILVSELLGSFGDNELSPECLDGAQRVLKDDGISIPCASTSYVAPLTSSKLYNEVRALHDKPSPAPYEMPYVVHIHNGARIAEPLPMFTFVHPNKEEPIDNTRYGKAEFVADKAATLHGIAGYFDTTLYKDIKLSIHPHTYSEGMFSWFPIFFPLIQPMDVREGDKVTLHFWRKADKHKVWYEWCVRSPYASRIHNPNARSYSIGL